jgi:hypothetical protein
MPASIVIHFQNMSHALTKFGKTANHCVMTAVEKIEKAIASLKPDEVRELAVWFAEYHADIWDAQIANDASEGRLDKLADAALAQHRAGRTTPL